MVNLKFDPISVPLSLLFLLIPISINIFVIRINMQVIIRSQDLLSPTRKAQGLTTGNQKPFPFVINSEQRKKLFRIYCLKYYSCHLFFLPTAALPDFKYTDHISCPSGQSAQGLTIGTPSRSSWSNKTSYTICLLCSAPGGHEFKQEVCSVYGKRKIKLFSFAKPKNIFQTLFLSPINWPAIKLSRTHCEHFTI